MMNVIFSMMVLSGILFGALMGRMDAVSAAVLGDAQGAVELVLALAGNFCLWGGVMKVAEASGLTQRFARLASPVTRRLFHGLRADGEAMGAITMNLAANLLGLGNAATPLGIRAMRAMEREEHAGEEATDNMALFVAMNTASLQLLPTTTALLRAQAGSAAPLDILPAVWLASAVSIAAGITCAKLFSHHHRR
jgi:spore maturation protein A